MAVNKEERILRENGFEPDFTDKVRHMLKRNWHDVIIYKGVPVKKIYDPYIGDTLVYKTDNGFLTKKV